MSDPLAKYKDPMQNSVVKTRIAFISQLSSNINRHLIIPTSNSREVTIGKNNKFTLELR